MNEDELKQLIQQKTGISEQLLTGQSREEILSHAKSLLSWKAEQTGLQELRYIENSFANYPETQDAGAVELPYKGSAAEQFEEWAREVDTFSPFESRDGWRPL